MLSPISLQTYELNDQGFSIKVENDRIRITRNGRDTDVHFNCLYNKSEIDNLIAGGGGSDPDYLRNICLTAVNQILAQLVTYNSLIKTDGKLNIVTKDVQHASNQIYELFKWTNDNFNVIHEIFNEIKQCHCGDAGGLADQVNQLSNDVTNLFVQDATLMQYYSGVSKALTQHDIMVTLPSIYKIGNIFNEAHDGFINDLYKFWAPSNKNDSNDTESGIVDPSQEIANIDIPLIDDPNKRTYDEKKPVYGTLTIPYDLQVNGLINGVDITDIQPGPGPSPGESYFVKNEGYNYFYVKNEDVVEQDFEYNSHKCRKLVVNGLDASTINKLKKIKTKTDIFRFMLRKNEIFEEDGTFIKDFYCYVDNGELYCTVAILISSNGLQKYQVDCVRVSWDTQPFVAFDVDIPFEPYSLFLRGEISIMYLLHQDNIESKIPEIKCDIIDARNALKLHESNVVYLYKPSKIDESELYYSITFHIDPSYTIPTNMNFVFEEYCFNNTWNLTWTGREWIGNNIQGRSNGKMINKLNRMCDETDYFVAIGIVKNDFDKFVINQFLGGVSTDEKYCLRNIFNRHRPIVNGKFDNGDDFTVERGGLKSLQSMLNVNWIVTFSTGSAYPVYNDIYACPIAFYLNIDWNQLGAIQENYLKHIEHISLDLNIGGASNLFTFQLENITPHDTLNRDWGYALRTRGVNDCVEELNVLVQKSDINPTNKDVVIRLDRSTLRPREEINWNVNTNPFQYIIDQQFYKIIPNPNAAATLYTDFNITSSKIITADNITTMRSDLNIVANTTDMIDFDLKALTRRTDNLETEVRKVNDVVQHIEKEISTLKLEAGFALGISCVDALLGGVSLTLAGNAIKMGSSAIRQLAANGSTVMHQIGGEMLQVDTVVRDIEQNLIEQFSEVDALTYANDISVNITPIYEWVNAKHVEPKFNDDWATTGEDDATNPNNIYVAYSGVHRVCMYYRDSLKPAFKLVADKFEEIESNMNDRPKFSNFVEYGKESPEIIFSKYDHNTRILFKFEHDVFEGSFDFRVTFANSSSDFVDLRISLKSKFNEKGIRTGYEISEFICVNEGHEADLKRFVSPHFDDEGRIEIDAVSKYNPDQYDPGDDIFDEVELLASNVTVLIPQRIENLVYKDSIDSLSERVSKLEKGNSGLTSDDDIERRLAILEAKCAKITLEKPAMMSMNELTIEERLQILERKCASIEI